MCRSQRSKNPHRAALVGVLRHRTGCGILHGTHRRRVVQHTSTHITHSNTCERRGGEGRGGGSESVPPWGRGHRSHRKEQGWGASGEQDDKRYPTLRHVARTSAPLRTASSCGSQRHECTKQTK
jgi:hypothetical protein